MSSPVKPIHTISKGGLFEQSIKVCVMTKIVPPTSFKITVTMKSFTVFGGKRRSTVVGQGIAYTDKLNLSVKADDLYDVELSNSNCESYITFIFLL